VYRIGEPLSSSVDVIGDFEKCMDYGKLAMQARNRSINTTWSSVLTEFISQLRRTQFQYPKDIWEFDKFWAVQPPNTSKSKGSQYGPHFLPETFLEEMWKTFEKFLDESGQKNILGHNEETAAADLKAKFSTREFICGQAVTQKALKGSGAGAIHIIQMMKYLCVTSKDMDLLVKFFSTYKEVEKQQMTSHPYQKRFQSPGWVQQFLWNLFIGKVHKQFLLVQQNLEFHAVVNCLRKKDVPTSAQIRDVDNARLEQDPVHFTGTFPDYLDQLNNIRNRSVNDGGPGKSGKQGFTLVAKAGSILHKMSFANYHLYLKDVIQCILEYGGNPVIPIEEDEELDCYLKKYME